MNVKIPDGLVLRGWQSLAQAAYYRQQRKNFTVDVVPGGGKTKFALLLGSEMITDDQVRRFVVITHTDHLRNQWIEEAAGFGLDLVPDLPRQWGGQHGLVTTFQQASLDPAKLRSLITRRQLALAVIDEIHHAADNANWGNTLGNVFQDAHRRLLLTGTPFRHDEKKIVFVRYENGRAQVDFQYSYRQALNDGVVAPVFFPTIGGEISWKRGKKSKQLTFDDQSSKRDRAVRLDIALRPDQSWLPAVIKAANLQLKEIRSGEHGRAGGLIVCKDQHHARQVAALVKQITGSKPELVISDIADASDRIAAFRDGDLPWMVAVRMISEGVDIPRLRVGIFATNVTTELFFRQLVGRLIRTSPDLTDQSTFLFIPRDPLIMTYAREIEAERVHVITTVPPMATNGTMAIKTTHTDLPVISIEAITAAAEQGEVLFGNETFSQDELARANRLKQQLALGYLPDVVVARILRAVAKEDSI